MEMTPQRWENTRRYLAEVFGREDEHLAGLMPRALQAGLPDIAVSSDVGRLLMTLAAMAARDGASTGVGLELGTLAGYSGIWLARGLAAGRQERGATLITVDAALAHAAFARQEFARAALAATVECRVGLALEMLPQLAREIGPEGLDLAFLDAVKSEYPEYLAQVAPLIRRGGLLIADNALGGRWWIDEPPGTNPDRDAVDAFNRALAARPDFIACCVPIREGVAIAWKV